VIHSYPWYVADWRQSETRIRLSLAERAIYRELIDYCWLEGSMPSDERTLAMICGCDSSEFRKAWKNVKSLFLQQDDRLTHHRVVKGRDKIIAWSEARRQAGKKGGLAKSTASSNSESIAKRDSKPSTSTSSTIPEKQTPPPRRVTPAFEPFGDTPEPAALCRQAVEECATFWPNIGNKTFAASAWEREAASATNGVDGWCIAIVETARIHAVAHIAAKQADRRHFIPTLERWVKHGDYTSPPPKVIGQKGKFEDLEIPED